MSEPRKPIKKPLTEIEQKSLILFRLGFLRVQDRHDTHRIEARWRLYQSSEITQKTARSSKPQQQKVAAAPLDVRS